MKKHILVILTLFLFASESNGQYNFFLGENDKLATTMNGFGSISFPPLIFNITSTPKSKGNLNMFYSLNFGYSGKRFRFKDFTNLSENAQGVIVPEYPDPTLESYTSGFFSYTKSKLYTGVIRLRPEIVFATKNNKFSIGTGPLVEFTMHAKHKRKYYDLNNNKRLTIIKGVNSLNLNRFNMGWGMSMGTSKYGVFSYAMFTPQFKAGKGPKVYAAEVGIYIRYFEQVIKRKKDSDAVITMATY